MTNQETFNIVARKLMKQMNLSVNSNKLCVYRGPNGLKCAAGHLIDDEDYTPQIERSIVNHPSVAKYIVKHGHDIEFVTELQRCHDLCLVADSPYIEYTMSMQTNLYMAAQKYGLDTSALYE